jgi:adenylate kinase
MVIVVMGVSGSGKTASLEDMSYRHVELHGKEERP